MSQFLVKVNENNFDDIIDVNLNIFYIVIKVETTKDCSIINGDLLPTILFCVCVCVYIFLEYIILRFSYISILKQEGKKVHNF